MELEKPRVERGKHKCGGVYHSMDKPTIRRYTNYPRSVLRFPFKGKRLHPTQKPLELFEYLVRTYTNAGDLVLDNCMGSGTTAVACLRTGRRFVGFETDEAYFKIAQQRVEEERNLNGTGLC